ncbi:sugar phosphate isomerase/epimerase family protein [Paenibacillus sepulcri]|uniref:TIM barrel protein n=1 Tax=Paenibacillus sepulcri TaxID=359917 RepID=A0ABS7CD09_9BACL|nr:TIM barrel protein [Paenibacillus sepulcri]
MELSLSMWSVHRTVREQGWTVMDFLSFCSGEGIKRVELLNVFWQDLEQELPQVLNYIRDNGITVVSYAVANDFVHESAVERSAALKQITEAFPTANVLGTSMIRVFSGNLSGSINYETALDWIVDGLSEAARQAELAGMVLGLENHGKLAGSGEQVQKIIDRVGSPALRSTFDTGNFLLVGEHPTHALEVLLPLIAHVHVKDFYPDTNGRYTSLGGQAYEGIALGKGEVEVKKIVNRLREHGYQGAFVLEYEGLGSEVQGILDSFAYFNSIK